jgi:hypothetical protein
MKAARVKHEARATSGDPVSKWEAAAWALEGRIEPLRAPFHVLAGEALDVARFCRRNWSPIAGYKGQTVRPGLSSAVGNGTFTEAIADEIIQLQAAFQAAQTRYRLLITGVDTQPMECAQFILGELRSTLEWLFHDAEIHHSAAQLAALDAAHHGALSQDAVAAALFDYAELADRHRQAIAGLGGFEKPLIEEARALGNELRELSAGPAAPADPPDEVRALEFRNRLGMLLYDRMQRVRAAARFVFRHQPDLVRQVTSVYARRQRAAHRSQQRGTATEPTQASIEGMPPSPRAGSSRSSRANTFIRIAPS